MLTASLFTPRVEGGGCGSVDMPDGWGVSKAPPVQRLAQPGLTLVGWPIDKETRYSRERE